jgi:hypothetical protein
MADRTMTAANIAIPDPHNSEIHAFLMDDPTADLLGKPVYVKSNRKVALAQANGGGKLFQAIGVVVSRRGRAVSVLKRGFLEGIDCENMTAGDPLFLSDTAGAIADAASGTKTVPMGRAMPCTDGTGVSNDVRLLAYIDVPWAALVP